MKAGRRDRTSPPASPQGLAIAQRREQGRAIAKESSSSGCGGEAPVGALEARSRERLDDLEHLIGALRVLDQHAERLPGARPLVGSLFEGSVDGRRSSFRLWRFPLCKRGRGSRFHVVDLTHPACHGQPGIAVVDPLVEARLSTCGREECPAKACSNLHSLHVWQGSRRRSFAARAIARVRPSERAGNARGPA